MKKMVVFLLMCMMMSMVQAQPAEIIDLNADNEADTLAQRVQTYYQHPNVKQAFELSNQLMDLPFFETQRQVQLNTWLWGAQIIKAHPFRTRQWCKKWKANHSHDLIAPFFQFADTASARRCLKSLNLTEAERQQLAQLPDLTDPLNRELIAPSDLDLLWTIFFATGNPKAVHKLVDFIANYDVQNSNQNKKITYSAAIWSLQSNMNQDAEIHKIVNDYIRSLNPVQQQFAKNSLNLS